MENKLQALTDKLFMDGLSKGKEEGEKLLAEAKSNAERMVNEAKKQAEEILEQARKNVEEMRRNAETDVQMASRQEISRVKKEIEETLMAKTLAPAAHSAMEDKQFVQNLILKALSAFDPVHDTGMSLELLLPEADRAAFDGFIKGVLGEALKAGVEVKFAGDLQGGFRIASKAQGYQLSFTEEDFMGLFKEYARPRIKQMLF